MGQHSGSVFNNIISWSEWIPTPHWDRLQSTMPSIGIAVQKHVMPAFITTTMIITAFINTTKTLHFGFSWVSLPPLQNALAGLLEEVSKSTFP